MRTLLSLAERTREGANLLDTRIPNWHRTINPECLDIEDGVMCPLGQLTGTFFDGLTRLKIDSNRAVELGFYVDEYNKKKQRTRYAVLTIEWKERVAERMREDNMRMIAEMHAKKRRKRFIAMVASAAVGILCVLYM